MKKTLVAISVLTVGFTLFSAMLVFAQNNKSGTTTGENPGLLPTSPFYFLKEWQRDFMLFITKDPVKKANLELQFVNDRLSEIKKLQEINPDNAVAIVKAVASYQNSIEGLKANLDKLKSLGNNPAVSNLLNKLLETVAQHQQFFDDLKARFQNNPDIQDQIKNSENKLNDIISQIPKQFEDIKTFAKRMETFINSQPIGSLIINKILEIKNRLIPPETNNSDNLTGNFCGSSTFAVCSSDADCLRTGCSSEICGGQKDNKTVSACIWKDCYNAADVSCGCVNSQCQWHTAVITE